jgi:hypothetical protein
MSSRFTEADPSARMAKLADAADLKSAGRKAVGVQVPLWAPENGLAARIRAAILLGSCFDGGREDRAKELVRRTVQDRLSGPVPDGFQAAGVTIRSIVGGGVISGSSPYERVPLATSSKTLFTVSSVRVEVT